VRRLKFRLILFVVHSIVFQLFTKATVLQYFCDGFIVNIVFCLRSEEKLHHVGRILDLYSGGVFMQGVPVLRLSVVS
jgi:hypothetical protein